MNVEDFVTSIGVFQILEKTQKIFENRHNSFQVMNPNTIAKYKHNTKYIRLLTGRNYHS